MNKLEMWLLRKLIRKVLAERQMHILSDAMWAEAKRAFYEDNAHTRFGYLTMTLEDEFQQELRECRRLYTSTGNS